ncbi:fatty acid desaturase 6 isoform X2 [Struthio camelus]|uniref:fatty acid desaturase 6 isoform X2 n=1 Tax=Struthio camelus TaxID=8801 RepID=UPI003603B751
MDSAARAPGVAGGPGLGAMLAEDGAQREDKRPNAPNGLQQPPRSVAQRGTPAPGQPLPGGGSRTEATVKDQEPEPARKDEDESSEESGQGRHEEALMAELSELVREVVKSSSWWERHGVDVCILALSFLLLPAAAGSWRGSASAPGLALGGNVATLARLAEPRRAQLLRALKGRSVFDPWRQKEDDGGHGEAWVSAYLGALNTCNCPKTRLRATIIVLWVPVPAVSPRRPLPGRRRHPRRGAPHADREGQPPGQPQCLDGVQVLGQSVGHLLHRALFSFHGRAGYLQPREDPPRLHQRHWPGRLQHLEASFLEPLRLHVHRASCSACHNPSCCTGFAEERQVENSSPDHLLHASGSLFPLLDSAPRLGLPVCLVCSALHAGHPFPPGTSLYPREYLPAHRPPHVRGRQEAQADSAHEPRRAEPAPQRSARLVLRPLAHQLPRGAPPLPRPLRQHVPEGCARRSSRGGGWRKRCLSQSALRGRGDSAGGVRPSRPWRGARRRQDAER